MQYSAPPKLQAQLFHPNLFFAAVTGAFEKTVGELKLEDAIDFQSV